MKKLAIFAAAAVAATFAALAAFDVSGARAIPALAPQTVTAGTTNEAALVVSGLRGTGALYVSATGDPSRTALDVTLWATNRTDGGWTVYAAQTFANTNAGVYSVTFPGEYLPQALKVSVGSIGAATPAAAVIVSY